MILIVDDKKENIIPLQKILELHNLKSDFAESGEEALKKILYQEYLLIIMDVQMPGMDGFEVVEALAGSNRTKDIPVIFLSAASTEKRFIAKGYQSGGVDYIVKPADPDLLILKVKTFLRLYTQQKELRMTKNLLSAEIDVREATQKELQLLNGKLEAKVVERTSQLLRKNEELEMRNHELQQFAWVVSHDLKEPIRKIETFVRLLKERHYPEDSKAVDYINRAIGSAGRMVHLIDDLLDYARLSAKVKVVKTNLDEVLAEVLNDIEYLIEEKNAVITSEPLPVLPGIRSQLRQLFQNLIGNALKFSREGIAPEITITSERIAEKSFDSPVSETGNFCRITFQDNGIGFEEVYKEKIFIIFQSLHDRHAYDGTGIGLAISKKIIEKHEGLITAHGEPGKGARFIVILPLS